MATLTTVRSFLAGRGLAASSPESLLGGLHARRADAGFWRELRGVVGGLQDARVSPRLVEGHERLGGRPLAEMIDALRVALPAERPTLGWVQGLPAAALAAFVVLGTACTGTTDGSGDDTVSGDCQEATTYGVSEAPEDYCALVALVQGASVSSEVKGVLLDCLSNLSAARRAQLLASFESMNDNELASALEELAYSSECDYDPGH